jgi:hypothetical protein
MKNLENKTIVAFHIGRGGRFNNAGHTSFVGEKSISNFVDSLFLNEDETEYTDGNGNKIGLTVKECNSGIGIINIDGGYDTTYTCYLQDCSDEELEIIAKTKEERGYFASENLYEEVKLEMIERGLILETEDEEN